jgi:predicted phosphodiesterase
MVLEFPILSDYSSLFLEELGGKMIYLPHGHPPKPPIQQRDIQVSGHTHIPEATQQDGIFLVNPGSVAIPKGGFPPSYCIYKDRTFTIADFEDNTLMEIRV